MEAPSEKGGAPYKSENGDVFACVVKEEGNAKGCLNCDWRCGTPSRVNNITTWSYGPNIIYSAGTTNNTCNSGQDQPVCYRFNKTGAPEAITARDPTTGFIVRSENPVVDGCEKCEGTRMSDGVKVTGCRRNNKCYGPDDNSSTSYDPTMPEVELTE
jgi:hypothetical protein